MRARKDLTGERFGKLVVVSLFDRRPGRHPRWTCACDCGGTSIAAANNLRSGHSTSCGGAIHGAGPGRPPRERDRVPYQTHGRAGSAVHAVWCAMRRRCSPAGSPKERRNYFDRGIRVCDRWQSFENFLADMGEPPAGYSIDRIDNDRGYEPGNCRWADAKTQGNNKRTNRVIEYDGQRMTLTQWADRVGLKHQTLLARIRRGWAIDRALTEPAA